MVPPAPFRLLQVNLRRTEIVKAEEKPSRPVTDINVASILERANAIRQVSDRFGYKIRVRLCSFPGASINVDRACWSLQTYAETSKLCVRLCQSYRRLDVSLRAWPEM